MAQFADLQQQYKMSIKLRAINIYNWFPFLQVLPFILTVLDQFTSPRPIVTHCTQDTALILLSCPSLIPNVTVCVRTRD